MDEDGKIDYKLFAERLLKQNQIQRELSGREIVIKEVKLSVESKSIKCLNEIKLLFNDYFFTFSSGNIYQRQFIGGSCSCRSSCR